MRIVEWVWIPGFENKYEVSSEGQVRSHVKKTPRLLKPGRGSHGYFTVALGRGNSKTLHEVVALAFLGERKDKEDVRHIDGDKTNNNVENLCYGTRSENNRDTFLHGKRKISPEQVLWAISAFDRGLKNIDIAKELGVSKSAITHIKKGRQYVKSFNRH